MYCDFYNLSEKPFNVTPDPKFLYLNARYREALASLHYGITERKGFVTLIGEAGTGKTTILNRLLDQLDEKTKTVLIFNTNVTFEDILEYIFAEFDLPVHSGKKLYMLQRLNTFLLEELRGGGNVALLIDEAQDLEFSVLEDLRLLSNLETAKEKILQIVLSGQPELGVKLSSPVLRQLRQRIAVNCRLLPLSREELSEYVRYRLEAAGCSDPRMFTREAEDQVWHFSRGIPRLVNVVCDNALVIGYALGKKRIGGDIVQEAAADLIAAQQNVPEIGRAATEGEQESAPPVVAEAVPAPARRRPLGTWAIFGAVAVALAVGLLSMGRSMLRQSKAPEAAPAPPPRTLKLIRPGSQEKDLPPVEVGSERITDVKPGEVYHPRAVGPGESEASKPAPADPAAEGSTDLPHAAEAEPRGELKPSVNPNSEPKALAERNTVGIGTAEASGTAENAAAGVPPAAPVKPDTGLAGHEVAERGAADAHAQGQPPAAAAEMAPAVPRVRVQGPEVNADAEPKAAKALEAVKVEGTGDGAPEQPPAVQRPAAEERGAVPAAAKAGSEVAEKPKAAVEVAAVSPPEEPTSPPPVFEKREGAPRPESTGRFRLVGQRFDSVAVRAGESLSSIAVQKYGQATYTILDLMKLSNPEIEDIDRLSIGQTLALPELTGGFSVVTTRDGRFDVLVYSSPTQERAVALAKGLTQSRFRAEVLPATLGAHKRVYRVVVGPQSSEDQAAEVGKQVQRAFREDDRLARLVRY